MHEERSGETASKPGRGPGDISLIGRGVGARARLTSNIFCSYENIYTVVSWSRVSLRARSFHKNRLAYCYIILSLCEAYFKHISIVSLEVAPRHAIVPVGARAEEPTGAAQAAPL